MRQPLRFNIIVSHTPQAYSHPLKITETLQYPQLQQYILNFMDHPKGLGVSVPAAFQATLETHHIHEVQDVLLELWILQSFSDLTGGCRPAEYVEKICSSAKVVACGTI